MTERHFYKHKVTGVIAPLNDTFAAVFGDVLERVGKDEAAKAEETPAKNDAPKEGEK